MHQQGEFVQIQTAAGRTAQLALLQLGFRPFFLLAGLFAVVSVVVWAVMFAFDVGLPTLGIPPMHWHGHEMVFGFVFAVIAGFLLTAVRNWTQLPTLRGAALGCLAGAWVAARLVWLVVPGLWPLAALFDVSFGLALALAISVPVLRVRQWRQVGVITLVFLLAVANAVFYAGLAVDRPQVMRRGLYGGLYVVLCLIFVIARRVLPFFIERGVDEPVQLSQRPWADRASVGLLIAFAAADLFAPWPTLTAILAGVLFLVHILRLADWYTPALWRKPMLWILYIAYGAASLGFLLKAASVGPWVPPLLAVHAWTVGGIGMMTLGMMARVSLGHTGRSIHEPPSWVLPAFVSITLAFLLRVGGPLLFPRAYSTWVTLSAVSWVAAFALFVAVYTPILLRPRVDGQPG